MNRLPAGPIQVYVSDFGMAEMDGPALRAFAAAPKRKDGELDMRFRQAKVWEAQSKRLDALIRRKIGII